MDLIKGLILKIKSVLNEIDGYGIENEFGEIGRTKSSYDLMILNEYNILWRK